MNHRVDEALSRIAGLYSAGLEEHGANSKSVGWKDPDQQILRFEKLTTIVEGADPFTANDFGCGYGAMFPYLSERFGPALNRYVGYDISTAMLAAAAEHVGDRRAVFVESDEITEVADFSFVSGTFNVRFETDEAVWQEFVEESIIRLGRYSRRGFAFNLLSTYVDWKEDHLFYGDPRHFFDFCVRHISRRVTLLHDYPLYEWTICVRH